MTFRARLFVAWKISVLALLISITGVRAADAPVTIGILTDMNGPYADQGGHGSVVAAQIAIDEFGGHVLGHPIKLISADHQNKVNAAVNIVNQWYDEDGVDIVLDVPNSAIALAVQDIAKRKNKIDVIITSATTDLTGKACSPDGFAWVYDTYSLAKGVVVGLNSPQRNKWFFIVVDYNVGHAGLRDATRFVQSNGGTVVGSVFFPLGSTDFSSYLLRAQGSGADFIGVIAGGQDVVNLTKQAREFHIFSAKQQYVSLNFGINVVNALGLDIAQGIRYVEGFYWDRDGQSRAFSKKFFQKVKRMPSMMQAGVYSATLHYLRAVAKAGTKDTNAVVKAMREMPVNDAFTHGGKVRPDGLMEHDMLLVEVKKPDESKYPWDYLKIVKVIAGKDAFRPLAESPCPLISNATKH